VLLFIFVWSGGKIKIEIFPGTIHLQLEKEAKVKKLCDYQ